MKRAIPQILFFVVLAVILGVVRNVAAPGGIEWVGNWTGIDPTAAVGDDGTVEPPPSYEPATDPPLVTPAEARQLHADPNVIFVDARYPEEYEEGSIPGAVLLPFEMFDDYWPGVEPVLPVERTIVTYCSGAECEMSIFLARLLRDYGYKDVRIFHGGARLWVEEGLPMDTLTAPPPGATPEL